jgi:hypothetical protein
VGLPAGVLAATTEGQPMRTTTTTREYDDEGRVIRETVVEYEATPLPQAVCTCAWRITNTFHWCPVHGHSSGTPYILCDGTNTVTASTGTTFNSAA